MSKWLTFTDALAFMLFLAIMDAYLFVLWRRRRRRELKNRNYRPRPKTSLLGIHSDSKTAAVELPSVETPQLEAENPTGSAVAPLAQSVMPAENASTGKTVQEEAHPQPADLPSEPLANCSEPPPPLPEESVPASGPNKSSSMKRLKSSYGRAFGPRPSLPKSHIKPLARLPRYPSKRTRPRM